MSSIFFMKFNSIYARTLKELLLTSYHAPFSYVPDLLSLAVMISYPESKSPIVAELLIIMTSLYSVTWILTFFGESLCFEDLLLLILNCLCTDLVLKLYALNGSVFLNKVFANDHVPFFTTYISVAQRNRGLLIQVVYKYQSHTFLLVNRLDQTTRELK